MNERIMELIEVLVDSIDEYDDRQAAMYEVALKIDALTSTDDDPPNIRYVNHAECVSVFRNDHSETGTVGFSNDDDFHFGIEIPKADLIEWAVGSRFQVVMLEAPHEG